MIGLDVKAVRIQPVEIATQHLSHSMRVFLRLLALSRSSNREPVGQRDGKVLVRTEWGEVRYNRTQMHADCSRVFVFLSARINENLRPIEACQVAGLTLCLPSRCEFTF